MPPERHSMNEADGEILTLDEVAAYLKAGKKTAYRLAHLGQIPGFKLGGTWRFRRSDLERWIAPQNDTNLAASPNPADECRAQLAALIPEAFSEGQLDLAALKRALGESV